MLTSWTIATGGTRHGRPEKFDKGSLHALLTNPIYIGRIKHKEDLFDGEHEPIIEPDQFRQVQARLQHNCRTGGVEVRNRHGALLKGILVCKACDRAMTHTFTSKGTKRYRYYTCTQAIKKGRRCCPTQSLSASQIEEAVVDQFRDIATSVDLRAEVLRQAVDHAATDLDSLRSEGASLKRELTRHHAEIRRLAISGEQSSATTALIAGLHDRIAQAESRTVELKRQIVDIQTHRLDQADVDAAFGDFNGVWNTLSPREQAQALALVIARVLFDAADSSIDIEFQPSAIKALTGDRHGNTTI